MVEHRAEREAEIAALGLLDRQPPEVVQHLLKAARILTGADDAQLNVLTTEHQETLVDSRGSSTRTLARDSVCARVLEQPDLHVVLPDASEDELYAGAGVVARGDLRGYAASKLVTSTGVVVGTVCVFSKDRLEVDSRSADVLAHVAEVTMAALETQASRVAVARELDRVALHQAELERTRGHLEAFAAQVGHDVQAPLSAISMSLELLDDQLRDPAADAESRVAQALVLLVPALSSARRLQQLVTGLLDFALHAGRLRLEPVDLAVLVDDVLADLGTAVGRTEVEHADLPVVHVDRAMVGSLLQNFLTNAFKYAGAGADPVVRVRAVSDGRNVRLEVDDNGPGVPPEQREEIFEALVRGRGDRVRAIEGLGIGLATCRRVAHAHGGAAGVDDSDLGGARFWAELPLAGPVAVPPQ